MFKHLHHIGVVYKDISKIAEIIKEMYGIEFQIDEVNVPINTVIKELKDPLRIKLAHATIGNTGIEIFEPLDDKSIYSEYLKEVPEVHKCSISVRNSSVIVSHFCLVSGSDVLFFVKSLPFLRFLRAKS